MPDLLGGGVEWDGEGRVQEESAGGGRRGDEVTC